MDELDKTSEKKYIIITYVLIGILIVLIGLILYLKFGYNKNSELYSDDDISLDEIVASLNVSDLANRYASINAEFIADISDNSLIITYVEGNTEVNFDVPVKNNRLVFTITDNNNDIITNIYKEVATIICMYYENAEINCRYTLDNITADSNIKGIEFDGDRVYIDMNRSIEVNSIEYNTVTITDIKDSNYTLKLSDIRIKDIMVSISHMNITVMGNIERLTSDRSNLSILVKLYDRDGNVLGRNTYEFNTDNPLQTSGTFLLMFEFDDTLNEEDVTDYSIEIIK